MVERNVVRESRFVDSGGWRQWMLGDAELVERVLAGNDAAFDELYRRHAASAWRVGQAVAGNGHDAADAVSEAFARVLQAVRAGKLDDGEAFRSYLLTATRHAAVDSLRRGGRARATDAAELESVATTAPSPADRLTGTEDAGLVAEAFRNLPERWRSVLWLTEVEGVATKDAADQLGLSANGTAQLAVRARAGLRDRYLQAHVKTSTKPTCRFTVERLGAYVGGGLASRDLAKVDQHLAGCAECRARKDELDDLGPTLRRIALPIPLTLGASSAERVHAVLTAASLPAAGFGARAVQLAKEPTPFMKKALGASAAGVFALGLLALPFASDNGNGANGVAGPTRSSEAPAVAELPAAAPISSPSYGLSTSSGSSTFSTGRQGFTAPKGTAPKPPAAKPAAKPAPPAATKPNEQPGLLPAPVCAAVALLCPGGNGAPAIPGAPALPPIGVGVNLGGHDLGVTVTPAPGASIDDTTVVAPAPATPAEPGITVQAPGVGSLNIPLG
ncbi:MAG: hypothetical protein JWO68_1775 [Actinomycetia bacterium]|nr:hypothetical protein [Actinomycetes bacterium]